MSRKKLGSCSLCGNECFEVKDAWPSGPYAGEPRKLGKPLIHAWRATFALKDGSSCDMTICRDCVREAGKPENLPILWRNALEAYAFQLDNNDSLSAVQKPVTPQARADVAKLTDNVPLAMIAARPWTEVMEELRGAR